MYGKIITLSMLCACLSSCINNNTLVKIIHVDVPLNIKCHFYIENKLDTLKFERTIKIIKNTLTDTIIFGNGVLRPKYLGDIEYLKFKNEEGVLDLDYSNPPADRIWIKSYRGKKSQGVLEFELIPTNQ